jgi:hypothetical protein
MSLIKDIKYELDEIDFSKKSLRKFGISIGLIFILIGIYFIWKTSISVFLILLSSTGILLFLFGFINPKSLLKIYKYWMMFALILGWFVSRIILTILFYFVITPIGIAAKLLGKNFLNLSKNSKKTSFWIQKNNLLQNIEKMY